MNNDIKSILDSYAPMLRDEADRDYIAARSLYFLGLWQQFLWSAQQCLEKYLKAIFLFRTGLPKKLRCSHDLRGIFEKVEELLVRTNHLPLRYPNWLKQYCSHLFDAGLNRYVSESVRVDEILLTRLDEAVWTLRPYCQLPGNVTDEVQRFKELIRLLPPQRSPVIGGYLERIENASSDSPLEGRQRAALVRQNQCYGRKREEGFTAGQNALWNILYLTPRAWLMQDPQSNVKKLAEYICLSNQKELIAHFQKLRATKQGHDYPKEERSASLGSDKLTPESEWIIRYPVIGNSRTQRYDFSGTGYCREIKEDRRACFESEDEAKHAGYTKA